MVAFLMNAFQIFPWDKLVVQLDADGTLGIYNRKEYQDAAETAGAVIWLEESGRNAAARTNPESIVKLQKAVAAVFIEEKQTLRGCHPTDIGFIFAQGGKGIWGRVRVVCFWDLSGTPWFSQVVKITSNTRNSRQKEVVGCK